ncbi:MAG TPA: c-type cytochrome, partial [Verrucomicrobiae bacterium]|nr:c-type cytochrome [Verrucomicrobiae bacterium]
MNRWLPFVALGALWFSGCGRTPKTAEVLAPSEVLDFGALYSANCAGCHGENGRGGAAIALANPVYLALADERTIRNAVANGLHGTAMPAFAQSAGGLLTNQQIDVIAGQIQARWSKPGILDGANP